jgi:hypothetical protein
MSQQAFAPVDALVVMGGVRQREVHDRLWSVLRKSSPTVCGLSESSPMDQRRMARMMPPCLCRGEDAAGATTACSSCHRRPLARGAIASISRRSRPASWPCLRGVSRCPSGRIRLPRVHVPSGPPAPPNTCTASMASSTPADNSRTVSWLISYSSRRALISARYSWGKRRRKEPSPGPNVVCSGMESPEVVMSRVWAAVRR